VLFEKCSRGVVCSGNCGVVFLTPLFPLFPLEGCIRGFLRGCSGNGGWGVFKVSVEVVVSENDAFVSSGVYGMVLFL